MILGILAAGAALVLLGFAVVGVRDLALGRRALAPQAQQRTGDILVPVTEPAGAALPLVRPLAVTASEGPITVHWCIHPGDSRTSDRIADARRRLPRADLRVRPTVVESRQVAATAMAVQGLADTGTGAVAVIDEAARPASRDPGTVLAALAVPGTLGPVATCPGPSTGMEPGEALAARALCDHAPLLFAIHGPAGLWPLLAAAPREAWDRASMAPLAGNLPTPIALLATVSERRVARLVPLATGMAPGSVRRFRRRHLQWLAHHSRGRTLLTALCLAATPSALLAVAFAPAGPPRSAAWATLALAAAARGIFSGTWTRTVLGPGPAFQAWLLSPWRDLRTLASLLLAAVSRDVRFGDAHYRVTPGGTLAPAPRAEANARQP